MSFLSVAPDAVTAASGYLADLGSSLRAAHGAAAAQTTAIAAPAADEVSAAITSFFGTAGQEFQTVAARAAAFHDDFVGNLQAGLGQYVAAEAANAQQAVGNAVGVPTQGLSGALTAAATETINLPVLGAITISGTGSLPNPGPNGPFSVIANATNQLIGTAGLSFTGNVVTGPSGVPGTEFVVTGGNLTAPALVGLLSSSWGPSVTAGASLSNSFQTFISDLSTGNLAGAVITGVTAPGNLLSAVAFGTTTVNLPIDTTAFGGPVGTLSIPFNGVFTQPQPITATWPTFTVQSGTTTFQVDGVTGLPIGNTSGFVPYLLSGLQQLLHIG